VTRAYALVLCGLPVQAIKLIVCDGDGTLLTSEQRLAPRVKDAIARANDLGVLVREFQTLQSKTLAVQR
jgi:hypothetical protein